MVFWGVIGFDANHAGMRQDKKWGRAGLVLAASARTEAELRRLLLQPASSLPKHLVHHVPATGLILLQEKA